MKKALRLHRGGGSEREDEAIVSASRLLDPSPAVIIKAEAQGVGKMTHRGAICRAMKSAALTAWCWTLWGGVALAVGPLPPGNDQSETITPYTGPYALVIFSVLLGLLVVFRSGNRRERRQA